MISVNAEALWIGTSQRSSQASAAEDGTGAPPRWTLVSVAIRPRLAAGSSIIAVKAVVGPSVKATPIAGEQLGQHPRLEPEGKHASTPNIALPADISTSS